MKNILQSVFILAVVALACHVCAADNATSQYTGTVVDEKGLPVEGATVGCYHYQSPNGFGYWDREPQLQQTTVTDGKGAFAVSASADTTLVVVKKPGLATVWKTWSPEIPDSTDPIVLTAPATLSGVVVDDNGRPVPDAEVWVAGAMIGDMYDNAAQMNELRGQVARSNFFARTTADGRFRIVNFPADGRAGLAVKKAGIARHTVGSELGGERDCQPGQDLKLVVGPAGNVEGKVLVAETGQPLAGVKIQMDQFGAGVFGSDYYEAVETRADGTFRVADVQPGKHCIRAGIFGEPIPDWVLVPEESQILTVTAGETTSDMVVHFSKGALVEVTVVVTNKLTPIANAAAAAGGYTAKTDSNGVALLRLPAGTNWFSARKDWFSQTKKAGIDAGQINRVRIELTPAPVITGTVLNPSGTPAAGVRVSFHPGEYPDAPDYAEVMTDNNGRYQMSLKISREDSMWDGPISPTNFIMAQSLGRNLAAIQEFDKLPTNLDLTLKSGITLTGSVKDSEGAPVTNATVDIRMLSGGSIGRLWPQPVWVDAQGSFTLPALPQGRQYEFWQGIKAKGYGTTFGHLKTEDSKTNHYEFPVFVLKRANLKLAGQILGRDGKPVAGANVNMSGQGQFLFRETKSDGQGHFIFNEVCAGEVRVNARYSGGPDSRNSEEGDLSAQGGDTNVIVRLGIHSYVYPDSAVRYLSPLIKTTGTVSDQSGAPVAGAKVTLGQVSDVTDNKGRYEINWQGRLTNDEPRWLVVRDPRRNLTAMLQLDQKLTNLDLTLQDGMTLTTRVSDTDGQRLTNATVSVSLRLGTMGLGVDSQPFTADERGQLRITALPQGQRYMLQFRAPGHTSIMQQISADDTKTKLLELPPIVLTAMDRDVAGQVLDNEGKPAVGVSVHLFQGGGRTTNTDANGHFIIRGVPPGLVSFDAGLPQPGTSAYKNSGTARGMGGDTNIVIRLGTNPDLGASISQVKITTSGTMFDPSGKPAPGVLVDVLQTSGLSSPARSDANGRYSLQWQTSPMTNKPVLFARDQEHDWAAIAEVEAKTASLDIHLQPGLTLSGSVQNSGGKPVTNAVVQLVPFPPVDPRWGMNRQPPTNATVRGLFSFTALPQGVPYRVRVSANGYWPANIQVTAANTKVEKLELPKTVLELADQQVAGQVLGLSGKPCWGAEVTIEDENLPSTHVSHTDSNGKFVISGVSKGLLNVRATFSGSGDNPQNLLCTNQVHGGDRNIVLKLGVPVARPNGSR